MCLRQHLLPDSVIRNTRADQATHGIMEAAGAAVTFASHIINAGDRGVIRSCQSLCRHVTVSFSSIFFVWKNNTKVNPSNNSSGVKTVF